MTTQNFEITTLRVEEFNIRPYEVIGTSRTIKTTFHTVKFFDENWILQEEPEKKALALGVTGHDGSEFLNYAYPDIGTNNRGLFNKAVFRTKAGDSYEDFISLCKRIRFKGNGRFKTLHTADFKIEPHCSLSHAIKSEYSAVKFFDENWTVTTLPAKEAFKKGIKGLRSNDYGGLGVSIGSNDVGLFYEAVHQLKEGDTYDRFIEICNSVKRFVHNDSTQLERFVAKVNSPSIERETGNTNKSTFDFVRIYISLNAIDGLDLKTLTAKHFPEVEKMALNKIADSKAFQKFGVPVNVLRLSLATITLQSELMLLFEIKDA